MPSPTDSRISSRWRVAMCSACFGLVLFGHVHAVIEDEGAFAGQLHAAAAEGDAAVDAVTAAERQGALPLFAVFEGIEAVLESRRCPACPADR